MTRARTKTKRPSRAGIAGAVALAIGLALSTSTSAARAAGAADEALAETLFTSGKALMRDQRWDEACAKFDSARKLSPGIGVTMWLAECHEKAGRLATAWIYFREASASAGAHADDRKKLADARAKKLEPRLARIRIDAQGFAGEIYRDDVKLPEGVTGEVTPVDPGTYRFRFVETSGAARVVTVDARDEGRTYDVRPSDGAPIANAAPAPKAAPPNERATNAARPLGKADTEASASRPVVSHTIGWALLGVAAVGVGVGAGFGLDASSKNDRSNDGHCVGNACDREGLALRDDAFGSATVSTIAFAVGAGALAAGVLVLLDVFGHTAPRATASVGSSGPSFLGATW